MGWWDWTDESKGMIKIENREISENSPTFIIAEAACNHMCDMKLAKKMIKEAKAAGADAIKFQTYKAERLVCQDVQTYWNYSSGGKSQFEYYKRLDKFERKEYKELFDCAEKCGIIAFSTPFDVDSASMLNDLGAPLFKIASCDLIDVRLLRHVAGFGKPLIISTGAGTTEEVKSTVNVIFNSGNRNVILMVCTLSYPAPIQEAHLRRVLTFKKEFPDLIIGYSDHTPPDENMIIPSIAVSLGAKVIEKHFTLDRTKVGSGHSFSIEPKDLKKMVDNIRLTEQILGKDQIKVYGVEELARKNARRSLVADRDIKKGEKITNDMIGIKRPSGGFSPALIDQAIGKTARCNITKDRQINPDDLE